MLSAESEVSSGAKVCDRRGSAISSLFYYVYDLFCSLSFFNIIIHDFITHKTDT